jgi:hypothetical protein
LGAAQRFAFDLSNFERINEIMNNLKDIPEFVDASPQK